jgi:hypothetical protein
MDNSFTYYLPFEYICNLLNSSGNFSPSSKIKDIEIDLIVTNLSFQKYI